MDDNQTNLTELEKLEQEAKELELSLGVSLDSPEGKKLQLETAEEDAYHNAVVALGATDTLGSKAAALTLGAANGTYHLLQRTGKWVSSFVGGSYDAKTFEPDDIDLYEAYKYSDYGFMGSSIGENTPLALSGSIILKGLKSIGQLSKVKELLPAIEPVLKNYPRLAKILPGILDNVIAGETIYQLHGVSPSISASLVDYISTGLFGDDLDSFGQELHRVLENYTINGAESRPDTSMLGRALGSSADGLIIGTVFLALGAAIQKSYNAIKTPSVSQEATMTSLLENIDSTTVPLSEEATRLKNLDTPPPIEQTPVPRDPLLEEATRLKNLDIPYMERMDITAEQWKRQLEATELKTQESNTLSIVSKTSENLDLAVATPVPRDPLLEEATRLKNLDIPYMERIDIKVEQWKRKLEATELKTQESNTLSIVSKTSENLDLAVAETLARNMLKEPGYILPPPIEQTPVPRDPLPIKGTEVPSKTYVPISLPETTNTPIITKAIYDALKSSGLVEPMFKVGRPAKINAPKKWAISEESYIFGAKADDKPLSTELKGFKSMIKRSGSIEYNTVMRMFLGSITGGALQSWANIDISDDGTIDYFDTILAMGSGLIVGLGLPIATKIGSSLINLGKPTTSLEITASKVLENTLAKTKLSVVETVVRLKNRIATEVDPETKGLLTHMLKAAEAMQEAIPKSTIDMQARILGVMQDPKSETLKLNVPTDAKTALDTPMVQAVIGDNSPQAFANLSQGQILTALETQGETIKKAFSTTEGGGSPMTLEQMQIQASGVLLDLGQNLNDTSIIPSLSASLRSTPDQIQKAWSSALGAKALHNSFVSKISEMLQKMNNDTFTSEDAIALSGICNSVNELRLLLSGISTSFGRALRSLSTDVSNGAFLKHISDVVASKDTATLKTLAAQYSENPGVFLSILSTPYNVTWLKTITNLFYGTALFATNAGKALFWNNMRLGFQSTVVNGIKAAIDTLHTQSLNPANSYIKFHMLGHFGNIIDAAKAAYDTYKSGKAIVTGVAGVGMEAASIIKDTKATVLQTNPVLDFADTIARKYLPYVSQRLFLAADQFTGYLVQKAHINYETAVEAQKIANKTGVTFEAAFAHLTKNPSDTLVIEAQDLANRLALSRPLSGIYQHLQQIMETPLLKLVVNPFFRSAANSLRDITMMTPGFNLMSREMRGHFNAMVAGDIKGAREFLSQTIAGGLLWYSSQAAYNELETQGILQFIPNDPSVNKKTTNTLGLSLGTSGSFALNIGGQKILVNPTMEFLYTFFVLAHKTARTMKFLEDNDINQAMQTTYMQKFLQLTHSAFMSFMQVGQDKLGISEWIEFLGDLKKVGTYEASTNKSLSFIYNRISRFNIGFKTFLADLGISSREMNRYIQDLGELPEYITGERSHLVPFDTRLPLDIYGKPLDETHPKLTGLAPIMSKMSVGSIRQLNTTRLEEALLKYDVSVDSIVDSRRKFLDTELDNKQYTQMAQYIGNYIKSIEATVLGKVHRAKDDVTKRVILQKFIGKAVSRGRQQFMRHYKQYRKLWSTRRRTEKVQTNKQLNTSNNAIRAALDLIKKGGN